jgi:hypothetical protein
MHTPVLAGGSGWSVGRPDEQGESGRTDGPEPYGASHRFHCLPSSDALSPSWLLCCTAFEQGDWLAELDLLQLGQVLQRNALVRGSYDGRAFDLMICIADVLEADHGWSIEQSEAWLVRMGLWEEEF